MEFTLAISAELTLQGGVTLPSGSILRGSTMGLDTTPTSHDNIRWGGAIYASQTAYDAGEKELIVKGLTEGIPQQIGQPNANIGITGSIIKSTDFKYGIELVGDKSQLTATSFTSFQDKVKDFLAAMLGISKTDIS